MFKQVRGFEGLYEVSDQGVIRSLDRLVGVLKPRNIKGKELKQSSRKQGGYCQVSLCKDGKKYQAYVHRVVAETWIHNPNNYPQVNHKDGNKSNNSIYNLEWVSCKEKIQHAIHCGLTSPVGINSGSYKGDILVFNLLGEHIDTLCGNLDMVQKGYDPQNINACLAGRRKTHRNCTFKRVEL